MTLNRTERKKQREDVLSPREVTKVRSGGNIVEEWIGLEFKSQSWQPGRSWLRLSQDSLLSCSQCASTSGQGGWRRGRLRRRVRRLEATFPFPFPRNRHQAPPPEAPAAVVSQRPREPAAQPLLKAAGWVQTSRCPHLQGGRQDRQARQGAR